MGNFQSLADVRAIEAEMPFAARDLPKTIYGFLSVRRMARAPRSPISCFRARPPNPRP